VTHVRLPYRITLTLGTFGLLAILAGCGRGANQGEVEALRKEVADLKQANAQLQTALASLQGKATGAPMAPPGVPGTVPAAGGAPGDGAKREAIYRIPVNFAPRKGPPVAAVTVVEFADFQCPFCKSNAGLPGKLLEEFPNDVQFAFKNYPLGKHPQAFEAAKAGWAAHQQGKFWEMHDTIYSGDIQNLSPEVLRGYAQRIGLDMARYDADIASDKATQAISFDKMLAKASKVGGTPTYFVNGKRVSDASPASVRAKVQQEIEAFRAQVKP
jgi:protein-disulfide isomerase